MPGFSQNPGEIADQRVITNDLDDVPANGNALFPKKGVGALAANAVFLGPDGSNNGTVKLYHTDGTTSIPPAMAASVWHSVKPFTHVYFTGTTADTVMVGRTYK